MGSTFQNYQQAQFQASHYAKTQRRIKRYTLWYFLFSLVSSLVTVFIAPKLLIPSLLVSASCYGLYRFGSWAYTKTKHWYLDRQALKAINTQTGPSEKPLLAHSSRIKLRSLAHQEITQALIHKQSRVSYYAKDATFIDSEPLSYNDRKHQRALFQYRMLENTKTAALQGNETFVQEMQQDKQERRERKLDFLKSLLTDFLLTAKVSISLRAVERSSSRDEWVITGEKNGLFALLETWNGNIEPFLPMPAGLSQANKEKFLCQSLLPLLLDRDQVFEKILPISGDVVGYQNGGVLRQRTYSISSEYVRERIKGIEGGRPKATY